MRANWCIYPSVLQASRANNVSFIDDDLDLGEIGGNLSWLAAVDDSEAPPVP